LLMRPAVLPNLAHMAIDALARGGTLISARNAGEQIALRHSQIAFDDGTGGKFWRKTALWIAAPRPRIRSLDAAGGGSTISGRSAGAGRGIAAAGRHDWMTPAGSWRDRMIWPKRLVSSHRVAPPNHRITCRRW
jgi:hypothetical protein